MTEGADERGDYYLLQEIHRKQLQVEKLRKEVVDLRTLQQHSLDLHFRPALQMIIKHVECRRDVEALERVRDMKNLPCLLYIFGAMVPLPGHRGDQLWSHDWRNWLEDHGAWVAKVVDLNEETQLHPSPADTFAAKEEMERIEMPALSLFWWDELRVCAGMPCWKESRNKMYW